MTFGGCWWGHHIGQGPEGLTFGGMGTPEIYANRNSLQPNRALAGTPRRSGWQPDLATRRQRPAGWHRAAITQVGEFNTTPASQGQADTTDTKQITVSLRGAEGFAPCPRSEAEGSKARRRSNLGPSALRACCFGRFSGLPRRPAPCLAASLSSSQ